MRKFRQVICFALAAVLLTGFQSLAAPPDGGGESGNPGVKLARGVTNLATGWLEIPVQMAEQKKTDPTAVLWVIHGFLRGLAEGASRTLYGAWDIATFPVAPYDAPVMDPDTLIKPKTKPRALEPLPPAAK